MRHSARPPFVPDGQTPLDDRLNHPLLDVINEGEKARETGNSSPYHGHSLEHCLHAIGWVYRDLRLALDATRADNARLREVLKESKHDLFEIMYSADDPYESSEDYTNNFPWIVQCARTAAERIDAALAEKEQSK